MQAAEAVIATYPKRLPASLTLWLQCAVLIWLEEFIVVNSDFAPCGHIIHRFPCTIILAACYHVCVPIS